MSKKSLFALIISVVVTVVIGYMFLFHEPVLSNYPKIFSENTIIVVGENASFIERKCAEGISEDLENLTGYRPEVKNDSELESNENLKRNFNIIVVGTPESNTILKEMYSVADVTRISKDYPGGDKGILEIVKNPWNKSKVILLVEGWKKEGVKFATLNLIIEKDDIRKEFSHFLVIDFLNESWVKEKVHGGKEEIFQEALENHSINVWISFTKENLNERELLKLKQLGVIVNWDESTSPLERWAPTYYKAIIPREHLDNVAKLYFVGAISRW